MNKVNNTTNPLRIFSESNHKKEPRSTSSFQDIQENKHDFNAKKKREKNSTVDAKVTIPEAIKEFAKIKKIVDEEPTINNEKKINRIRNEIKAGSYNINYEQLADKIIENEF